MYIVSVFVISCLMSLAALMRDRAAAARVAWAAAMLVPVWMSRKLGAIVIDIRVVLTVVLIGLLVLLVDRRRVRLSGWVFTDVLVLGLVATQVWSMHLANDLKVSVAIQIVLMWVAPYVFGRLLAATVGDLRELTATAAVAIVVLSIAGLLECVTGQNPIGLFFFGKFQIAQGQRWGLTRAIGSMDHPIYFGVLMVMLLPWGLYGAGLARAGRGPGWWRYLPAGVLAGAVSTLSRGPVLGVGLVCAATMIVHYPPLRKTAIFGTITVALLVSPELSDGLDLLHRSAGEAAENTTLVSGVRMLHDPSQIRVDGHEYDYNGTTHRLLQFMVLRDALRDSGWFGFGQWGQHPEHVAYLQPHWRNFFWSIDNHYILFTLESGRIGLVLFLALGLLSCRRAMVLSCSGPPELRPLATGMSVGIGVSLLLLLTVWFAASFGFFWLTNVGVLAQWWADHRVWEREAASAAGQGIEVGSTYEFAT